MVRIHHVAIWVKDLEKIKAFYETYFNLRSGEKYINAAKGYASYFVYLENTSIEIMTRVDIGPTMEERETFGWAHIAISLGSKEIVLDITERMRTNGIPILSEPRVTGDGFFEVVVADPEGNRIELTV